MNETISPVPTSFIAHDWDIKDIEGKVLTIVESLGLPKTQEDAVKSLARQAIWGGIHTSYRTYLWDETLKVAYEKQKELETKSLAKSSSPKVK